MTTIKMGKVLPESMLRLLTKEQRKEIGQMTAEEAIERAQAKNERELQGQIINLLRLRGIEPLWHRTDKKSHATKGWPDITFSLVTNEITGTCIPCAWEVKFGDGDLSAAQVLMLDRLRTPPNGWRVKIIRSLQEAIHELADLGVL
jgi:hypothetical protein